MKPEAQRDMPMAKGPMIEKLGLLTATAYTVDTSTNCNGKSPKKLNDLLNLTVISCL